MKKLLLSSLIGLSAASSMTTHADTLGFVVGANSWQQSYSGDVQSGASGDVLDIEDTLGFDDETATNFYAALEHPVPFIPNIRLAQTELEVSGSSIASFEFDGINYDGNIDSELDLTHTDITLYYEILDNWASLDIGFTVRTFAEGFTITGEAGGLTETTELEIDGTLPMLYAGVKFELPLTGLYVSASGNGIGYDDASIIDYQAGIGYETDFGLGIEAGFRSFEIEYDDDDEDADLTVDGVYAGLFYHF